MVAVRVLVPYSSDLTELHVRVAILVGIFTSEVLRSIWVESILAGPARLSEVLAS